MSSPTVSTAASAKFVGYLLSSNNYSIWSFEFQLAAEAHDVWSIIENTEAALAPDATAAAKSAYKLRHCLAKSQIVRCIDSEMKMKIMDKSTAHEMWKTLKTFHNGDSSNDKERRRAELHGLRFHDFPNIAAYLDAVLQKKRELINVSATVGDDEILYVILNALPKMFRYAASYVRSQNLSLDATVRYLIGESTAYKGARTSRDNRDRSRSSFSEPNPAFYSSQGRRRARRGHRKAPSHRAPINNASSRPNFSRHTALPSNTNSRAAFFSGVQPTNSDKDWFIDSGATAHLTGDLQLLHSDRQTPPKPCSISTADGTILNVESVADADTGSVKLKNVWYIPGIKENLVSVAQALDNGIEEISFQRSKVQFKQGGIVIATGSRTVNLFRLDSAAALSASSRSAHIPQDTFENWHSRLGHLNFPSIRQLHESGVIKATGITVDCGKLTSANS